MTDAELITEWNATGCRGCCIRWGLRPDQVRWRVRHLRGMGHQLKRWPRLGRPKKTHRHAMIQDLNNEYSMREISQQTGWTYNQVRYSCQKAVSR